MLAEHGTNHYFTIFGVHASEKLTLFDHLRDLDATHYRCDVCQLSIVSSLSGHTAFSPQFLREYQDKARGSASLSRL